MIGSAVRLPVADRTQASEARRIASDLAYQAGLSEIQVAQAAIVVTEAGNNLANHARDGEILLSTYQVNGAPRLNVLCIDRGPGMDVERCMKDGYSSAGTRGEGLGAITRLSAEFDVHSGPGGTVLFAAVEGTARKRGARVSLGAVQVPKPGETACGDSWTVIISDRAVRLMVADGLGHGVFAAEASVRAVDVFESNTSQSVTDAIEAIHAGIRGTRGAAVAVAFIDLTLSTIHYCGLGNIAGSVSSSGKTQHMVSMSGTAGHEAHKVSAFQYTWNGEAILVMHSDGLTTQSSLDKHPGVIRRHPAVIAGLLYREYNRGRDDATVVVVKLPNSK